MFFLTPFSFFFTGSLYKVTAKPQSTQLRKHYLHNFFKDDIEFKNRKGKNYRTQKEEKLDFQNNKQELQTCLNSY